MTPRMPNQRAQHHLVTVSNPAYAVEAMEQHLSLLLRLAGQYDKGAITDEQLYVWRGRYDHLTGSVRRRMRSTFEEQEAGVRSWSEPPPNVNRGRRIYALCMRRRLDSLVGQEPLGAPPAFIK
jgi:hypothetical protein